MTAAEDKRILEGRIEELQGRLIREERLHAELATRFGGLFTLARRAATILRVGERPEFVELADAIDAHAKTIDEGPPACAPNAYGPVPKEGPNA